MVAEARSQNSSWQYLELRFGGLIVPKAVRRRHGKTREERKKENEKITSELLEVRKEIRRYLSGKPEIIEIRELFEKEEREKPVVRFGLRIARFPPLMITLQLPRRLQEIDNVFLGESAERFFLVFDGRLLFIGAVSSGIKSMRGYPDVRDKLTELIGKATTFRIVPPNVTRAGFLVANGKTPMSSRKKLRWDARQQLASQSSIRRAMQIMYLLHAFKLNYFYMLANVKLKLDRMRRKVGKTQAELLTLARDFVLTSFYQIPKRYASSRKIRMNIGSVLELMSRHKSLSQTFQDRMGWFEKVLRDDDLMRKFLEQEGWKNDLRCQGLDSETTLAIIEHTRSEMETSGLVSVSLWAAIVGAIAASILTLLLSGVR
jgi:hypothetical protein